ncbi:hypothetical protein MMC26_001979 [Xylographa opegraphella]|nr:hypothetical protein [Xylographa opegraphella]
MAEPPTVTILLLGDSECGKSTFLSGLSHGQNAVRTKTTGFSLLRDLDQPFVYDIRMYNRPYRFEFYDTASPENYTLLHPNFVILCYDVNSRASLLNVQQVWRKEVVRNYARDDESIPVMLLGLKRDLRVEGEGIVYPQEGYQVAQEMRCDRYAECSAVSGELMNEVFEDVARLAARTTTEKGALSEPSCSMM